MKKSRSSFRPFVRARFLATIAIAVGFMAVCAWPAFMQGRPPQRSDRRVSSNPAERADEMLRQSLFVDGGRESEVDKNPLTPVTQTDAEMHSYEIPKVAPAVFAGNVRDLPQVAQPERDLPELEGPLSASKFAGQTPEMLQPNVPLAPMPNPIQNFAGLGRLDLATNGSGQIGAGTPPDTNGDVGPNHYIQSVNSGYGIFNKTGTLLASFTENSLFSAGPTGTLCDTNSTGDPVVLYDSLADRWILTNFAFVGAGTVGPFFQCIAASRTGDPVAGGWNLYAFRTDTGAAGQPPLNAINDYGKFGIWTDCLYYAANTFSSAGSYIGPQFASFSRIDMYSGAALTASLGFTSSTTDFFTMLPSHLSAPANGLPPAGRLNMFTYESGTAFAFLVRTFTPGTNCGGTGTLSAATSVSQTSYTFAGQDVAQPNTANLLDSLSDRLMQKNQYRNVGGTESLWVTHTVRTGSLDAPQWAQINVTGGTVATTPVQQQIYTPDVVLNRWMPSIAVDKDGNVALGYSTSNGASPNFPSIAYSGRLVGDALNMLPQTETQLIAGSGSQTGTCGGAPCHRWGDYSSMSVDPSDSCTFWYTTEYFTSQADGTNSPPIWSTRIGSFSFTQPTQCSPVASTPTVPAAPTGLSFTNVAPLSMTLNWTDTATNEDGYVIYRSTDNVNFAFAAQTAANAMSGNVTGLNQSTTYFFKVFAFTKGALSTALTGSQATTAPGVATSTAAGGLWSQTTTWASATVPINTDNVTIADGATVTIDTAAVALNVNVGTGGSAAVLQFEQTTARTLTVGQSVTIASNGTFQSNAAGTQTGHVFSVGTDLTNNGTLDFSTNTNTAGAGITFTGATNNTFGGTGGTTDIRTLTVNKGTSSANVLELNPTNFTVQGINAAVPVFLTSTNGTLKVSGTFSFSSIMFTPAAYTIGATTGFWLNNPNFTVTGQAGSPFTSGLLRITQGTFNIGTGTGNSMGFNAGSTVIVEGGAVNATGRFGVATSTNALTYTQSGGTITSCTIGTSSTVLACFDLGTSLSSSINISGGTIALQIPNSGASGPRDYRMQAGTGVTGLTGGTLQLGNAASGAAKTFIMRGVLPLNTVVTNTSAGHTGQMDITLVNYNNLGQNININSGATFNIGNVIFLMSRDMTNNGTLTANGASSRYYHFGNGTAQTYSGTGVVTAPLTTFELDNSLGLTLTSTNQAITNTVRLFTGSFTGANKITLGNGGATTGTVQIGNTTTPTAAGTFDVAPTFNLGTGGQVISYFRTTASRNTGPEINPTRTLTSMTYDDNDATHSLTIAGGDLTLSSAATAATLTNGRVITGANALALSNGTATVTRTNGYVDGNFRKNFAGAASKSFEVGTANGFSPVTVNATAGTFPATFTVKAVEGPQPSVNASTSIQRFWTLTNSTVSSADLTFQYLVGDVMGTEANYKVIRISGGTPVAFPTSTVNTGAHTASLTGATSFSDWTVGENVSPTAANGNIGGTISDSNGAPLAGTTINLSGTQNRLAITDSNGRYGFDNVETNGLYTVTPSRANYTFSPANRSFSLLGVRAEASFTATANNGQLNPLDTTGFFVRQHYLDFLAREPDPPGFIGWVNTLRNCAGGDSSCDRVHVSEMFYRSQEFQERGYFAYRFYTTALGRKPDYAEFVPDLARVSGFLTNDQLEAAKTAFIDDFMTRPAFARQYDSLSDTAFVDTLMRTAGVDLSNRQALIDALRTRRLRRAQVLRQIAESSEVYQKYYNQAFVVMEYFGYLHRDPDALYLNWIAELDRTGSARQMVDGFVNSTEYRNRFVP